MKARYRVSVIDGFVRENFWIMIKPDEAVRQINSIIKQFNAEYHEEIQFHVSKEFANALKDAINLRSKKAIPDFVSGDEFKWKGYNCKVCRDHN